MDLYFFKGRPIFTNNKVHINQKLLTSQGFIKDFFNNNNFTKDEIDNGKSEVNETLLFTNEDILNASNIFLKI